MKITVRNMYNMSIETVTYDNAEVIKSADYKEFAIVINGEQIATYNRMAGMTYDIITESTDNTEETANAETVIADHKADTAYYSEEMTEAEMYEMLRYRMAFGEAETKCIIAALTLSGAKWRKQ